MTQYLDPLFQNRFKYFLMNHVNFNLFYFKIKIHLYTTVSKAFNTPLYKAYNMII